MCCDRLSLMRPLPAFPTRRGSALVHDARGVADLRYEVAVERGLVRLAVDIRSVVRGHVVSLLGNSLGRLVRKGVGQHFRRSLGFGGFVDGQRRSEEHTSELQSLMRISYAVFCLKKKNDTTKLLTIMHNSITLISLEHHKTSHTSIRQE